MYIFICTSIPQGPPAYMTRIFSSAIRYVKLSSHAYSIYASSSAAVRNCPFPRRFRDRTLTRRMVPAWTAHVSPTGLLPGLPTKALVAKNEIVVTRLPVVAAKPVGPALTVVQVHETLLAVAANTAAGRWKTGALTSPVRNSSVLPSAYRTAGSPAGLHAALACIPTCPLAAALAGLVVQTAAATR